MVNAHRVVRSNRPVQERPARALGILLPQFVENALILPKTQNFALHDREVRYLGNRTIHVYGFLVLTGESTPKRWLRLVSMGENYSPSIFSQMVDLFHYRE